MWDTDGREYVDYYLGSASLVLGHAHPDVLEAVRAQQDLGTQFFELTPAAVLLAEQLVEAVPCAERVKFANSGSEATAAALKLARAHTGRDQILKFEGAYHGTHDWAVWGSLHRTPLSYPPAEPDSVGVPRGSRTTCSSRPTTIWRRPPRSSARTGTSWPPSSSSRSSATCGRSRASSRACARSPRSATFPSSSTRSCPASGWRWAGPRSTTASCRT